MNSKNTGKKSSTTMNHISSTKVHNFDSAKNSNSKSGVRKTSCVVIFIKDKFKAGKNLLVEAFTKYNFESIKYKALFDRNIYPLGREMYMQTGENTGSIRNSPSLLECIRGFLRKISEMFRSFFEVIRTLTGLTRRIPEVLRCFIEVLRNFFVLNREIPGLINKISEKQRELMRLIRDFPGSFLDLSELFRSIPGLLGSLHGESGEREVKIYNR